MTSKDLFQKLKSCTSVNEISTVLESEETINSICKDEECFSKEEIKTLSESSLTEKEIAVLQKCKGTKTYYSPNYKFLDEKEKLIYEKTIFLSKPWRKTEIYNTLYGKK